MFQGERSSPRTGDSSPVLRCGSAVAVHFDERMHRLKVGELSRGGGVAVLRCGGGVAVRCVTYAASWIGLMPRAFSPPPARKRYGVLQSAACTDQICAFSGTGLTTRAFNTPPAEQNYFLCQSVWCTDLARVVKRTGHLVQE